MELGALQRKKSKNPRLPGTMEVGGWVQVSLGIFWVENLLKNSPKPVLIFWSSIPYMCILSVNTSEVVGYYDFSVLSMSVMGFQKNSLDGGWVGGGVSSILFF